MTTYGYGRVSTGQQTHDAQRDALTAHGIPPARIYLEKVGGARSDRPQFLALLQTVQPGDEIVTTRLDRFGRSVLQIINTVADLNARQVHIRTLTDEVNSRTPTGRLMMGIMASLAEYELTLIRERLQVAREAQQRRDPAATGGRPRSLTPNQLDAARQLRANGSSLRDTARALGIPRSTLHEALSRPPRPQAQAQARGA